MWRKGNTFALLERISTGTATMENSMKVLQKIKNRTTIRTSNSTLGYISPPKPQTLFQKVTCTPMIIAALFTIVNIRKQPKYSTTEWIKMYTNTHTHTHTHTHNGILLSHKKGWNFDIYNNMDKLGGHYTKWHKSDRERQIPYDITYMQNLNCTTN